MNFKALFAFALIGPLLGVTGCSAFVAANIMGSSEIIPTKSLKTLNAKLSTEGSPRLESDALKIPVHLEESDGSLIDGQFKSVSDTLWASNCVNVYVMADAGQTIDKPHIELASFYGVKQVIIEFPTQQEHALGKA